MRNDNCNKLEENDEVKKEVVDIEFIENIAYPENNENATDFRWLDFKGEDDKDTTQVNLIKSL